jgi:hypothetical protein
MTKQTGEEVMPSEPAGQHGEQPPSAVATPPLTSGPSPEAGAARYPVAELPHIRHDDRVIGGKVVVDPKTSEPSNAELAASLRYIADGLDGRSENDADCAALRLAAQRLEMPFADLNWYDGYDQAMKEIRERPITVKKAMQHFWNECNRLADMEAERKVLAEHLDRANNLCVQRERLIAEQAAEIERLRNIEQDYLRRHKDACDRYKEVIRLYKEVIRLHADNAALKAQLGEVLREVASHHPSWRLWDRVHAPLAAEAALQHARRATEGENE